MSADQRAVASEFKISVPPFTDLMVDVIPIQRTGSKKSTGGYACPTCHGPVAQRYHCPTDGLFEVAQLSHGQRTDEGMVVLDEEDKSALAGDEPDKVLELRICPRHELWAATRPGPLAYRLRPPKPKGKAQPNKTYAAVCLMASNPAYALYGVAKLGSNKPATPFTVQTWQGQLVLQSLVRPQDLAETDDIPAWTVADREKTMTAEFMKTMNTGFDAALLADHRSERLAAVLANRTAVPTVAELPKTVSDDEVFANLEKTLALLKTNAA